MQLTILIPALNEEETIAEAIKRAKKFLENNKIDGEILVVNNGSVDNTKNLAIKNGARVVEEENRGYGNAIKTGISCAKGKYIIMGDADNSYNFLEIGEIYHSLINGNDLVIGNRYYNMEKGAMKISHKYIGTPLLTLALNIKNNSKIKDINCGLRGFKKEKIQELNLERQGMELASEMIIKAIKNKQRIGQVNINFYKDGRKKSSHLRTIRDGIRHLKVIIQN